MIRYDTGGINFLLNVCQREGSVFPKALLFAIPSALVTAFFVYGIYDLGWFDHFRESNQSVMSDNAIWGGFNFLVGFLVVFRTSQAYNRFWEGVTQTHKMGAEWFDACSSLVAFCKHSTVDQDSILRFQNILVRLFSMLHAAALGDIEDVENENDLHYSEVHAFNMELIDAEALGEECLTAICDSDAKVELIFQWVQQLVVENIRSGVLSIPPPILSRSFQEIAVGMVHFHEAMKISNVPFPFPYAQTCDTLLLMHWLVVPFVVCQWVTRPWWAAVFSFIQVFTLWSLNVIAVELENPFGKDPNDIDGLQMQLEFNNHLRLLLKAETKKTPGLISERGDSMEFLADQVVMSSLDERASSSFTELWNRMKEKHASARRYSAAVKKFCSRASQTRQDRGTYRNLEGEQSFALSDTALSRPSRAQGDRASAASYSVSGIADAKSMSRRDSAMQHMLSMQSARSMNSGSPVVNEKFLKHGSNNGSDIADRPLRIYGIQGTWEPCGDVADDPQGNHDIWELDKDTNCDERSGTDKFTPPDSSTLGPGSAYASANDRNNLRLGLPTTLSDAGTSRI